MTEIEENNIDEIDPSRGPIRMVSRRGTAAQWQEANTRLQDGEIGTETDTGFIKVGDGQKRWNDLPYGAGGAPTLALASDISEADQAFDYDAARVSSVTVYWVFHEGASGEHRLNILNARPGVQVFFLGRNESGEPQTISGESLYWLPAGGAGLQFTTEVQGWMAANGAFVKDEQVGTACVLAVTA